MNEIVSQAPSKRTRPSSPEKIRAALHHNFELSQVPQDVANDIIDHVLENDFELDEEGLMRQRWNPLMAKIGYNYEPNVFEELAKRVRFPILHVTSKIFNSPQSIFSYSHPPFPVDMDACLSSVDVMEDAAVNNDVNFEKEYLDGSHNLHLTHAAELAALLRRQLQLDSTK
ncbi:Oidioi.mRNA.OKI2018_I69.chr1.g2811.t1.cds [Oikopleura dioica]|uniref:Oidioi.mRNA.OKI2018_I69.chr1.g2811.t1.cds n=1 Tax=Oikopleura dioica TaxID=34765 RepID=A0ABN7SS56_OIKDI|nr:Oidioi.mRNA.OKI2018_I69.chr1.g2811.t1.cds [Oikopleura dioica]